MATDRLRVGIKLTGLVPRFATHLNELPEFVVELERRGVDDIVMGEHILYTPDMRHPGGGSHNGMVHGRSARKSDVGDVLTLFAFMAARTRRVRFCSGVILLPLRRAAVMATQAATLDSLSGGRFDFGIGAGWSAAEYAAMATSFETRFAHLEDAVRACRALWLSAPTNYAGTFEAFENVVVEPAPVTPGGPPLWWGGKGVPPTARRVAALADGWIASERSTVAEIGAGVAAISDACSTIGRDIAEIGIRATLPTDVPADCRRHPDQTIEFLVEAGDRLRGVGVTHLTVPLASYDLDLTQVVALMDALRERR